MKTKLRILSVVLMAIIAVVVNTFLIHWDKFPGGIESIIASGNTDLNLVWKWWENPTMLVVVTWFIYVSATLAINGFFWCMIMFLDFVSLISAKSIRKDFEAKYYVDNFISMLNFGETWEWNYRKEKNALKYFSKMLGYKIFFLVVSPISLGLIVIKYASKILFKTLDPLMA